MVSDQRNGGERAGTNCASTSRRTFLAGTTGALSVGALGRTAAADEGVDTGNVEEGNDREQERDEPLLVAHRAFAGLYPENTVSAAEYVSHSGEQGWLGQRRPEWIEIDVAPTADGDIAVMHDDPLCDLTDVDGGEVFEESSETIFGAEVLRCGETVPSLEEVMAVIPSNIGVNIDVKAGSADVVHGGVSNPEDE